MKRNHKYIAAAVASLCLAAVGATAALGAGDGNPVPDSPSVYDQLVDVAGSVTNDEGVRSPVRLASEANMNVVRQTGATFTLVPFADGTGTCFFVELEAVPTRGGCGNFTKMPFVDLVNASASGITVTGALRDDVSGVIVLTRDGKAHHATTKDGTFEWSGNGLDAASIPAELIAVSGDRSWTVRYPDSYVPRERIG